MTGKMTMQITAKTVGKDMLRNVWLRRGMTNPALQQQFKDINDEESTAGHLLAGPGFLDSNTEAVLKVFDHVLPWPADVRHRHAQQLRSVVEASDCLEEGTMRLVTHLLLPAASLWPHDRVAQCRYPDEGDSYSGENLRSVAARLGFTLPGWYYTDIEQMPRAKPAVILLEKGDPNAPPLALDLSLFGIHVYEPFLVRHNVEFAVDYLGLRDAGALKCYAQTDGTFAAQYVCLPC